MDFRLLHFFNQTLAYPWLDGVMVILTTAGFGGLPGLGLLLFFKKPSQRRVGLAIVVAFGAALALALIFQYLAWRPRPEAARLLWPVPNFPSYPSGHATAAFAVAVVIGLARQQLRWWGPALTGAALIAISRVYLGVHYPSDILGGAILGASVGAACYGLIVQSAPDWRWLLWPQIAFVMVITLMAYLGYLPWWLLGWPLADKAIHFLLFGAVVFWLNLWLKGQSVAVGQWAIPVAILAPISIAAVEEGIQFFSPIRSADPTDLASDLLGMLFFFWLSNKFIRPAPPQPATR